jgi:RecA-family ATPase
MRYVCSLPNPGSRGAPRELIYPDDEGGSRRLHAFVEAENGQEGRGIYYCIGDLRDGARSRSRETVGAVPEIVVDLDLKSIEEPRERILGVLHGLPLPPSEIRDSGFGLHAVWRLKEAVADDDITLAEAAMKHLVELLAGDPAPTHRAALLRLPGTFNTKNGERRECRVVWQSNTRCDISEFDELFDLYGSRPLLTRKAPPPKANGHDAAAVAPLDVTAALAAMRYQDSERSFHTTLLRCSHALLRLGMPVEQVRDQLMDAARKAAAGDPRCADWDWQQEERGILRMAYDLINKNPDMVDQLPAHLQEQWRNREAAGETRVGVRFSGFHGGTFCVIGRKPRKPETGGGAGGGGTTDAAAEMPALALASRRGGKIHAIPFVAFDESKLRPRAFLYGKHYQRGQATATIGCDGAGKSTVGVAEAIVLATGRALLGEQPMERCRVWIHNADDDSLEIKRRIAACCRLHDVDMAGLEGWLFVTGKDNFAIRVASGNGQLVVDHATVASITETIIDNQIDVFIADPLVTLHSVAENDNVRMSEVIHIFGDIAAKCDCAIDVCHHTRKPSNGEGEKEFNSDDSRGASAVRAAVRASRVFNRMSKAEAGSAGMSEEDRVFYIRIDPGKANYLPPATKATWFQLKSVQLLNDEHVGAIAPWAFPGQDGRPSPEKTAADKAAEHVFLAILKRFNNSERPASDRRGANYAPALFSEEREAKAAKLGRAQLQAVMLRLLADGRICPKDERRGWQRIHTLIPTE